MTTNSYGYIDVAKCRRKLQRTRTTVLELLPLSHHVRIQGLLTFTMPSTSWACRRTPPACQPLSPKEVIRTPTMKTCLLLRQLAHHVPDPSAPCVHLPTCQLLHHQLAHHMRDPLHPSAHARRPNGLALHQAIRFHVQRGELLFVVISVLRRKNQTREHH